MSVASLQDALAQVHQAGAALDALCVPLPLPIQGLEAVVVGALAGLQPQDWWLPGLRERAGAVLRGVSAQALADGDDLRQARVVSLGASPALRALYAVGLAVGSEALALVHLGIGSASDGAWYEALNLAALQRPRVIFLVAVHPLDGDAPLGPQVAAAPSRVAASLAIPCQVVDGAKPEAVRDAVLAARDNAGPTLIEARLPGGHT